MQNYKISFQLSFKNSEMSATTSFRVESSKWLALLYTECHLSPCERDDEVWIWRWPRRSVTFNRFKLRYSGQAAKNRCGENYAVENRELVGLADFSLTGSQCSFWSRGFALERLPGCVTLQGMSWGFRFVDAQRRIKRCLHCHTRRTCTPYMYDRVNTA